MGSKRQFLTDATDKFQTYKSLKKIINDLRTKVREFNLPYLALPAKTPKEVALDVFIKMNTSSVRLSTYDIVVALVEEETGKSLHEHVDTLNVSVPRASEYCRPAGSGVGCGGFASGPHPKPGGIPRASIMPGC